MPLSAQEATAPVIHPPVASAPLPPFLGALQWLRVQFCQQRALEGRCRGRGFSPRLWVRLPQQQTPDSSQREQSGQTSSKCPESSRPPGMPRLCPQQGLGLSPRMKDRLCLGHPDLTTVYISTS